MSFIPTKGNSILVDTPETVTGSAEEEYRQGNSLTSWVMGKVTSWENHRNRGYSRRWQEYWRMWRGRWSEEDRNRLSERSRLIAPALSQAIEATVAEVEEGVLSKDVWVDIADDLLDEEKQDALMLRDVFLEDLDEVNAKDSFSEIALNAAIFGTGIAKINVIVTEDVTPTRNEAGQLEASKKDAIKVVIDSVRPDEFIPDPSGTTLGEMLGYAQKITVPTHSVLEKIEQGIYRKDALPFISGRTQFQSGHEADATEVERTFSQGEGDSLEIVEYHGKVPLLLLNQLKERTTLVDDLLDYDLKARPESGEGPLVEAIITIANDNVLLRAQLNPFTMTDRSFIAFQFEKVPGRFWGRGVAEKGYNPQKALDAEVRSRIDALGFISSPMLGVDAGRIPRGFKMEIKPGKLWLTNGNPNDVLRPVEIGNLNAATFNQAGEMERMVQMGTGSFDSISNLGSQKSTSGANSASTNSLMMGAFVKRSKRAIQNFSRNLVEPTLKKCLWRYMQFDNQRYPQDYKLRVVSGTGIVAREVEAMQLTQLLGMLPQDFPNISAVIAKGVVENSSVYNKAEIASVIDQAMQPPSEEEQQRQQQMQDAQFQAALAQAQGELLKNQQILAEIRETLAKAEVNARKADVEETKVAQEQERIALQASEIDQFEQQNNIALQRLKLQEKQLDFKMKEATSNRRE